MQIQSMLIICYLVSGLSGLVKLNIRGGNYSLKKRTSYIVKKKKDFTEISNKK